MRDLALSAFFSEDASEALSLERFQRLTFHAVRALENPYRNSFSKLV